MSNIYNNYNDEENDLIKNIEYVKKLYDAQFEKVKTEEYVKNLLFEDYVRTIKSHRSRYDVVASIFKAAQSEVGNKWKKERTNLETLKEFIIEDFLNNDKKFKLRNIISCGWEGYGYDIEFNGRGETFQIFIPIMDNITTENIEYTYNGMFAFIIKKSECWDVLKTSYKIEDIAEFIKAYFNLKDEQEVDS